MVENNKTFQIVANIVMILLTLCCLFPFLLLVMSSLTDETTLIREGYSIFPSKFGLESYAYLMRNVGKIGRAYGITVFVTIVGTTSSMLLTILMAYPLSRKELYGRNILAFFVFFTMLFNGGLVPTYIMYTRYLHIKNTMWALIFPALLVSAFYVIMMRTYFTTNIPDAVIEAARIDGAGEWRILFTIVLPLSLPMIATLALLIGLGYWNDWKNGLYYLTDTRLYSIQNMLNQMLKDVQFLKSGADSSAAAELTQDMPSVGIKMAIAVIGALPVMAVYPFFQKYFVKGITIGAVKG
ncbi:MAG: carbohydrate ABC transporter permease [Eubacteriales bacterium]|nr:carbohydrate ABC transporter permease [Eubacteriales bacterium]